VGTDPGTDAGLTPRHAQMAARRLIGLLLVVLVVSSVGAALVTPERQTASTTASAPTSGEREGPPGRLIERTVQFPSSETPVLRAHVGDQLELRMTSRTPSAVEIPRFGLLEHATPDDPARFSMLLGDSGRFAVRVLGGRTAAIIRVSEADAGGRRGKR
jgi:hypothetical protein